MSEDQLTWTFTLDPQETFHDGRLVRASDFVRAFQRIADGTARPPSFQSHLLRDVVGFEAAQRDGVPLAGVVANPSGELEIRLQRPNADLADILAHPALAPIPPDADQRLDWAAMPIGNGPFAMAEPWAHNQFIRLAATDPELALDEVLFRIYADDPGNAQQYLDFQAGQLHVAQVPPGEVGDARQRYGSAGDGALGPGLIDAPWLTSYLYGFDTRRPPFDQPEVRQAVSLLIDRAGIASRVMLGARDPADALLPPGMLGAAAGTCQWCRRDPDAARQLLEDAGIELDPEAIGTIVLAHNEGRTHAEIARLVAVALTDDLGLDVEVRALPLDDFAAAVQNGEANLFRLGWTSEHPMPSAMLEPLFNARWIGVDNVTGFRDAEVDALLDAAAATPARPERLALMRQAAARIEDLAPVTPLLTYRLYRVVATDVRGFRMDPMGRVDLARVRLLPAS